MVMSSLRSLASNSLFVFDDAGNARWKVCLDALVLQDALVGSGENALNLRREDVLSNLPRSVFSFFVKRWQFYLHAHESKHGRS